MELSNCRVRSGLHRRTPACILDPGNNAELAQAACEGEGKKGWEEVGAKTWVVEGRSYSSAPLYQGQPFGIFPPSDKEVRRFGGDQFAVETPL